jgi:hypothetical protein
VTDKVKHLHLVIIEIIKSMVKGQKFALTSDHWTSTGGINYLGITLRFINKDWKLVNLTLSCSVHSGRTTAAACKKEIMAALQLYDLNISDADTENTMALLAKIIDGDHHYCIELTTVSARKSSFYPYYPYFTCGVLMLFLFI